MNNVFVYCEIEEGTVADVSQELLTKGRALADKLNCRLEAVAAGSGLDGIERQIVPYGIDVLHVLLPTPHCPTQPYSSNSSVRNSRRSP